MSEPVRTTVESYGDVAEIRIVATILPRAPGELIEDQLTINISGRSVPLVVPLSARVAHPRFSVEPPSVLLGPVGPAGVKRRVAVRSAKSDAPPPEIAVAVLGADDLRVWTEADPEHPGTTLVWIEAQPGSRAMLEGAIELRLTGEDSLPYRLSYIGYAAQ